MQFDRVALAARCYAVPLRLPQRRPKRTGLNEDDALECATDAITQLIQAQAHWRTLPR